MRKKNFIPIAFSFIVMAGTMTNVNAGLFGHIIEHAVFLCGQQGGRA